jgi:hypothetical protein
VQIYLTIPVVKQLKPVHWLDVGLVKRIRGVAYSTRCSPQNANRLVRAHTPRRLGACEGDTLGARERAMLGPAMSRFRSLSLLKPSSQSPLNRPTLKSSQSYEPSASRLPVCVQCVV